MRAKHIHEHVAECFLHPFGVGGAYTNFMMEEGEERIRAAFGSNYARLSAIKAHYDPDNFFSVNQNIRPASRELVGSVSGNGSGHAKLA